jgi:hypothetical protein
LFKNKQHPKTNNKWRLGQTKEAMLQSAVMVVCVEEDGGGRDEEDSNPSLVTSRGARIGSYPDQEVVQEAATTLDKIPSGWTRAKFGTDC